MILSEITKINSHANLYGRHLELSLFKLIVGIFLISCDKLQIVVFLSSRYWTGDARPSMALGPA